MNRKTRYLQLSDTMMMEYVLNENDAVQEAPTGILYTKLKDGHYAMFSPLSCEYEIISGRAQRKSLDNIQSINTLQHLSVPTEKKGDSWFMFLDGNNEFITSGVMNEINPEEPKAKRYASYCSEAIEGTGTPFSFISGNMPGWDSIKIYFVNGYSLDEIFGILSKVYVNRTDGGVIDLCNFVFTKNTVYDMYRYLPKPVIFGNFVYDKYIEIKIPSIYDICNDPDLNAIFKINPSSPIRLNFSYVNEENVIVSRMDYSFGEPVLNDKVYCDFIKSITLKGAIPVERVNSDNLGCYISESADGPFLEFYGTWKDYPLSFDIVQNFNKTITLYDRSFARKQAAPYEINPDHEVEYNLRKWIAVHEIECSFMHNDIVVKNEEYSMTQVFTTVNENEITKFHYRPFIFESDLANSITSIAIKYQMKFINTEDRVQFVKSASLSLTDIERFYQKGTSLGLSDVIPYKVYNKVIESSQSLKNGLIGDSKSKYVKLFYNSTDITLVDGEADYSNGTYVLMLSRSPKNYKFVFRNKYESNKYKFFDLSNGSYKLYIKNKGENIILDPTYSSNMNMLLGELEFNLSGSVINKLYAMDESDRYMSIVSYNDDNSVSSMYDFKFKF